MKISALDRDALERAMEIARRDPDRARQIDSMLEDRPWAEVARFCAYSTQFDSLNLRLWEHSPSQIDECDTDPRDAAGRKLLRRMLAAGLSRFEPEPLEALDAARKELAT